MHGSVLYARSPYFRELIQDGKCSATHSNAGSCTRVPLDVTLCTRLTSLVPWPLLHHPHHPSGAGGSGELEETEVEATVFRELLK